MRTFFLCLLLIAGCYFNVSAQSNSPLQIDKQHPEQNQEITLHYHPDIALPAGKELHARVGFYNRPKYPRAQDVTMKLSGNSYTATVTVPEGAVVMCVAIAIDTITDANHGKGYLFDVYSNEKAVANIPGIKSFIYTYGDEVFGIKPDSKTALSWVTLQRQAYPATKSDYDNIYYTCLLNNPGKEHQKILNAEVKRLLNSDKETDFKKAVDIYGYKKNGKKVDSLLQLQLKRFPTGLAARGRAAGEIFIIKTAAEMQKAYEKFYTQFPPSLYDEEPVQYDYIRAGIAQRYAREKDSLHAAAFADSIQTSYLKPSVYNNVAQELFRAHLLETAKGLFQKAFSGYDEYLSAKKNDENAEKALKTYVESYCNYAIILYEQKDYEQALKYITIAYQHFNKAVELNYYYAKILQANGKNADALHIMDDIMRTGNTDSTLVAEFKTLYLEQNGAQADFNKYMSTIKEEVVKKHREDLVKQMINRPAKSFTLTDLDGRKVSLADLKNKVVVLDFWATWCSPCKKSLPAMAMTQKKYSNDPDVKFLFIHTWEQSNTAVQDAKSYIESQQYDFEVLMDLKDPVTKKNKVVESYGVTSIPAKFIIDPKGIIRFQLTGFDGDTGEAVQELSTMIDLAREEGKRN